LRAIEIQKNFFESYIALNKMLSLLPEKKEFNIGLLIKPLKGATLWR